MGIFVVFHCFVDKSYHGEGWILTVKSTYLGWWNADIQIPQPPQIPSWTNQVTWTWTTMPAVFSSRSLLIEGINLSRQSPGVLQGWLCNCWDHNSPSQSQTPPSGCHVAHTHWVSIVRESSKCNKWHHLFVFSVIDTIYSSNSDYLSSNESCSSTT